MLSKIWGSLKLLDPEDDNPADTSESRELLDQKQKKKTRVFSDELRDYAPRHIGT
jgi:hypothetical protein